MSNVTLTSNEITAMKATLNYNDRESQHSDNFSNAGVDELQGVLNWNKHQVAALIGSLEKKGMAWYDAEFDLLWLNPEGVDAIFDVIDNEPTTVAA
jgi:DNA-binding MarR family transcriptional regulator